MIHLDKNKVKTMVNTTCAEITDSGVRVKTPAANSSLTPIP